MSFEANMKRVFGIVPIAVLSLTAMAFAQTSNQAPAPSPRVEDKAQAQDAATNTVPLVEKPNSVWTPQLGNVTSTYAYVGSSAYQQKTINITGFSFGTYSPAAISCQPRQSANWEYWWPDQFACQVISTSYNSIRVRVRRLDAAIGWGQNLRLDFIVFDRVNN